MCKDKTPMEALDLTPEGRRKLAAWLGSGHAIGPLRGVDVETLVAAKFEQSDAESICEQVQKHLGF